MIRKLGGFMEKFWLLAAIVSVVPAAWVWYKHGFSESQELWLITTLCIAMWLFRGFTRKRMQAWEEREKERAKGQ